MYETQSKLAYFTKLYDYYVYNGIVIDVFLERSIFENIIDYFIKKPRKARKLDKLVANSIASLYEMIARADASTLKNLYAFYGKSKADRLLRKNEVVASFIISNEGRSQLAIEDKKTDLVYLVNSYKNKYGIPYMFEVKRLIKRSKFVKDETAESLVGTKVITGRKSIEFAMNLAEIIAELLI